MSADPGDKAPKVCVVYGGDCVCIIVFYVDASAHPSPARDARYEYGGKGLPPKGAKLKAKFANPLVERLERCSVSEGGEGCKRGAKEKNDREKGEKEKCRKEKGEKERGEKEKVKCGVCSESARAKD